MINVVVASNIFLFREGMKSILFRYGDIQVCAEATCMEDALEHDLEGEGKIVFIVSPLSWRNGSVSLELLAEKRTQRVVLVTSGKNAEDVQMALQLGVRALLTKACSPEQIIHAVRSVDAGKIYVSQEMAMVIANSIRAFSSANPMLRLTRRELDILKRIAIGRKMSTIGSELGISSKTVSAHKANIMEKLALSSDSELVVYALKNNLFDLFVDHSRRKHGIQQHWQQMLNRSYADTMFDDLWIPMWRGCIGNTIMESRLVQELIDDIVNGVYPDETLVRERFILTQSLHLLVFLSRRRAAKRRDRSEDMMRAAIKRMMQEQSRG